MSNAGLSDYIVFVDESGDHSLESINPRYPIFVLLFTIFEKQHYVQKAMPAISNLKISTFGHDLIIFHEHEIRKKIGPFRKLNFPERETLMTSLASLVEEMDFSLIPIIIDKHRMKEIGPDSTHIYHLAMQIGLEKLYQFLREHNQHQHDTHVIFEARGRIEDQALELEFLRICCGNNSLQEKLPFEIVIADKKTNSAGLQIADLAARPIGLSILRPEQINRAFQVFENKLYGEISSLPIKAKGPKVVLEAQTPVG